MIHPCCLTIAGSDSGGNAGVQADLRCFHDYRLHGCTVFAALTAQNPFGVEAVHEVPADFVAAQLDAVFACYAIAALKTGMLSSVAVVDAVADRLAARPAVAKVIDPVMVATSGARLVREEAVAAIARKLLPLATLVTPNLPEAEILLGHAIPSRDAVPDAARDLSAKFGCAVLVKGGHAVEEGATLRGNSAEAAEDVLFADGKCRTFALPVVPHPVSTHGTGCSLAAALASELALGRSLPEAVEGAKRYVHDAIAGSYYVGEKCGVLGFAPRVPSLRKRRPGASRRYER